MLSRKEGPIKTSKLFASARSQEQVQKLSELGVGAIQLDLSEESSIADAILGHESRLDGDLEGHLLILCS